MTVWWLLVAAPAAGVGAAIRTRARRRAARSRRPERVAPAVPQVVDTKGAGDALAAGWIVGGPDLALEAAARCVQRMGSMPDPTEA